VYLLILGGRVERIFLKLGFVLLGWLGILFIFCQLVFYEESWTEERDETS